MKNLIHFFLILSIGFSLSSCHKQRVVHDRKGNIKYYNLTYGDHKRNLYDVFVPNELEDSTIVIVVHGGGWKIGDKSHIRQANRILLKNGIASMGLNYPLVDKETTYKDQLAALDKLVHKVKDSVGSRPIALLGESSGGHISLLYAYQHPALINKVISFSGPTDLYSEKLKQHDFYHWYTKSTFSDVVGDKYKMTDSIPEAFKEASPITQVSNVPTLMFQGTWDWLVNRDQAYALDSVLSKKEVPHKLVILEGAQHTPRFLPWWRKKIYKEVVNFVHEDFSQVE